MPEPTRSHLAELVEWFNERVDPPPVAMHPSLRRRGVWTDSDDSIGSALGTPAWTSAWSRWLCSPPHAVTVEEYEDTCYHAGRLPGQSCTSCTVITEAGQILYTTGVVTRHRLRYRWPMRRVMHRLWRAPAREGRPNMGSVLWQLAVSQGDVSQAASALSVQWPIMVDPAFATGYVYFVLRRARRLYQVDVELLSTHPAGRKPRWREKSDAQLDAEASVTA